MNAQDHFRRFDTPRADGVYITLVRETCDDTTSNPRDYLFQDEAYREEDKARLKAYRAGDWCFIGLRVRAEIDIVRDGTGTSHTLYSAGLWGIESDSGEDYLNSVAGDEIHEIVADLRMLGAGPFAWRGARA